MKKFLFLVVAAMAFAVPSFAQDSWADLTIGSVATLDSQDTKANEGLQYTYLNIAGNWRFGAFSVWLGAGAGIQDTVKDPWAAVTGKLAIIRAGDNVLELQLGVPVTTASFRGIQPGLYGKWFPFGGGFYGSLSTYGSIPILSNPYNTSAVKAAGSIGDKFCEGAGSLALGYKWSDQGFAEGFLDVLANNQPASYNGKYYLSTDWKIGVNLHPAKALGFKITAGYDKWGKKVPDSAASAASFDSAGLLKIGAEVTTSF